MSRVKSLSIDRSLDPEEQEDNYVHNVYNEIAPHFSLTRYKPWPIVEQFLKSRSPGSIGIDVGCGNGKYLSVNPQVYIIGTDRSLGLVECARTINRAYNLGVADGLCLPHPPNKFDFAISIAVIHHFSTPQRRRDAIAHILSKLKPGAEALIYCWALEQESSRRGYKEGDEQDVLVPWVLQQPREKKPKTEGTRLQKQESNSPENDSATEPKCAADSEPTTKYRYYHLYRKGELDDDALGTEMCDIVDTGYERDNWWIIARRKSI